MKKLSIIAALAAVFTFSSLAYDSESLTLASNTVAGSTIAEEYVKIPCGGQKDVAVHIEFAMAAANTDLQTFVFARSVTGATNDIETLAAKRTSIAIAATGLTRSVTVTNVPTLGAGYIFFISHTNAAASVSRTNTLVKYAEKKNAP